MKNYLDLVGDLITVEEAAQLANVNKATILEAIDTGELTAITGIWHGKRTTREWLNAWIASKVVNPEAANLAGGEA